MNFNPFKRKPDLPTNETLIKTIISLAAQPTPQSWRAFYIQVLKSSLFIAEDPDAAPRPILFVDTSDAVILPVFTDVERLKKVLPDAQRYSAMPAHELCRLALQNGISAININPENGPGGFLTPRQMEALANGNLPDIASDDDSSWDNPDFIPMGNPKLPTQEELDKLTDAASVILQKEADVESGYIILMKSDDNQSVLTIALQFKIGGSSSAKTELTQRLVLAMEKVAGRPISVVWLEGEQLKAVKSRSKPFYQQESLH
jgi:hypothetical protein